MCRGSSQILHPHKLNYLGDVAFDVMLLTISAEVMSGFVGTPTESRGKWSSLAEKQETRYQSFLSVLAAVHMLRSIYENGSRHACGLGKGLPVLH